MPRIRNSTYSRRAASAVLATAAGGGTAFAAQPPTPDVHLDGQALPVERFGADAASPDNTQAINRALAYLRAEVTGGGPYRSAGGRHFLDFSGGVYRCQGSIDATGITGSRMWGLRFAPGCMIYSEAKGQIAFDLYQSRFAYLDNLSVFGSFEAPPAVGLFLSHGTEKLNGTGEHLLNRCRVNGCFTKAALYNYSAEETLCLKSFFSNGYEGDREDEVYAAVYTGRNLLNVESAFRTVLNPSAQGATRQTFNGNTALNCEFIRRTTDLTGQERGSGPALLLDDASTFRAWSYVRQWGAGHPAVRLRSSGGLRNLILHLIIEGNRKEDFPHYDIDLDPSVTLRDTEIVDHAHWTDGPLLRLRRNTRRINGLRIRKPLQGVELFATDYDGQDRTAKPDIRAVAIEDSSPIAYASGVEPVKPSIRLDRLRYLQGTIACQQDGFIEASADGGNFSGSIASRSGVRHVEGVEDVQIAGQAIEARAGTIRVHPADSAAATLSSINRPGSFPLERLTLCFAGEVTLRPGGNIRLAGGRALVMPARSVLSLLWEPRLQAWLPA